MKTRRLRNRVQGTLVAAILVLALTGHPLPPRQPLSVPNRIVARWNDVLQDHRSTRTGIGSLDTPTRA